MKITKKSLTLIALCSSSFFTHHTFAQMPTLEECYQLSNEIEGMFGKIPGLTSQPAGSGDKLENLYNNPTFSHTHTNSETNQPITTTFYFREFYKYQLNPGKQEPSKYFNDLKNAIISTKQEIPRIKSQLNKIQTQLKKIAITPLAFSYINEETDQEHIKHTYVFQDKNKANTHTLFYVHGGDFTGDCVFTNLETTTEKLLAYIETINTIDIENDITQPTQLTKEINKINEFYYAIPTDISTYLTMLPGKINARSITKLNNQINAPSFTPEELTLLHNNIKQQIEQTKPLVLLQKALDGGPNSPYSFTVQLLPMILALIAQGINVVLIDYDGCSGYANPLTQVMYQIKNVYQHIEQIKPTQSMLIGHSNGSFITQYLINNEPTFINKHFSQVALYGTFANAYYSCECTAKTISNVSGDPSLFSLKIMQTLNPQNNQLKTLNNNFTHLSYLLQNAENYVSIFPFSSQRINSERGQSFANIIKNLTIPFFLFQGTADLNTKSFSQVFDIIQSFKDVQYNNWQLFAFKHGTHHIHRAYSVTAGAARFTKDILNSINISDVDSIRKQEFIRFLETLPLIIKKETATNIETINLDEKINDAIQNLTDPIEQISSIPGMNYQWFRKHILQEAN